MTTVDIIILLVILLHIAFGLYRGFLATVLYTLSTIVSFIGSLIAANMLKEPLGAVLTPFVTEPIANAMPQLSDASVAISDKWDSLSYYLQTLLTQHGISLSVLDEIPDPEQAQQQLTGTIAQTAAETLAYFVVLIISFLLIKIIFNVLIRVCGVLTRLPILHSCNALLGGALGAAVGIILCTCVLWALKLVTPAIYSDVGILSPSVMEESPIASTLVGWNDGLSLYDTVTQA